MENRKLKEWMTFGHISILSVEDDGFNQELASAVFEELPNTKVLQANNGKEALEILKDHNIDVILLDLMMPEMDGFETLKIIKDTQKYQSIPVIVVTSKEDEKKSTYKLGANDFISKPYSPVELKLRVFNHLNIKRFSDLMDNIQDSIHSDNADSQSNLNSLQEVLKIADNSQKQLLSKLGNLAHADERKDEKASHRLGNYVMLLSRLYGLNKKEIDNLFFSMTIYDIGLLRIPNEKLKDMDTKEYKMHPRLGLNILEGLEETNLISMAKIITLSHHENWDGSGYPEGLKGEDISIYARIVSLIDYFDELTVSRCYDEGKINSMDALELITRERGVMFDPNLTDIFIDNFEQFREIKNKLT